MRFLRNYSAATAPNVYLLLYPRPALARQVSQRPEVLDQVFQALLEISEALSGAGRVYGGGLNKIEPKELEQVTLPQWLRNVIRLYRRAPVKQTKLRLTP